MLITRNLIECARIAAEKELGEGAELYVVVTKGNIREEL